ncbi:MAG: autotransporter-associated beta strand repeat-containing protein [Akkermansiaceae bacterium]
MKPKNNIQSIGSILATCCLVVAGSQPAAAAPFTFTGTATGTTTWSSATNWDAAPVSASTTDLVFGTGQTLASGINIITTQDITISPTPFLLNSLTTSYSGSGTEPLVRIQTGPLSFVSDGLTTPTIALNSTGATPPQLVFLSAVNFGNNIEIGGASSVRFEGAITNTGGAVVTKTGAGALRIQSNNAAYTGNFNVSGGLLQVGNNGNAGDAGSGTVTLSSGGAFTVRRNGATALTLNNTITGTGNVTFQTRGGFVAIVNKANDYIGNTSLQASAAAVVGGIRLGVNNGLSTSSVLNITNNGASVQTFNLDGFDQTLGGLSTSAGGSATNSKVTLGNGTLTVNDSGTRTFAGEISGAGNMVKDGAGTWTLTAANTYTGTTTIKAGSLVIGSSGSLANSSTIDVRGGTTFDVSAVTGGYTLTSGQTLSGTGTVVGSSNIAGTLSPGNSPGTLTGGSQTWLDGGDYNWQILDATGVAGTGFDTIAMTGTLDLSNAGLTAGGFAINLWSLSSIGPDVNGNATNFDNTLSQSWALLTASGGITGFAAGDFVINTGMNNGTSGFSNALGGGAFSLGTSGNSLVLNFTAVPEPGAALLGGLGLLALLRRRR